MSLSIRNKIINYIDYTQYKNQFNISEYINPIFNKVRDLISANTQDTVIPKTIKISNLIFETNPITYIQSYFQSLRYFNPFNSKISNPSLTTPWSTTVSAEPKEPSYRDLEISTPIVIDHTTTKLDTTAFSIEQIKKEISEASLRMDIFVNGSRCTNIKSLINHLGLTLNSNESDILPTDNSIISKILHFSHQGLFRGAYGAFQKHVMRYPDKFPAQIQDKPVAIHIDYDPKYPEKTTIYGEVSFHVKCMNTENILPYIYTVKTKHTLDKEEISWEGIKEEVSEEFKSSEEDDIKSSFVIVDSPTDEEEQEINDEFIIVESPTTSGDPIEDIENREFPTDDEFIMLEPEIPSNTSDVESLKDSMNNNKFETILSNEGDTEPDSDFHNALNALLKDTNSALKSGTTSIYLNRIKNKYPIFIYNDRLIYGNAAITTDEIINFLKELKRDNPSNPVIFLPFLVKGWTVDHAVVAVLNLSNETIEYFDPKGQSWFTTRAEKQSNKNVFDFLTEIGQKVISPTFCKEKVLYNKKNIPQASTDNKNCGAYCLQFIEERLNNSFDAIEKGIVAKLTNPLYIRYQLANNLIKYTY